MSLRPTQVALLAVGVLALSLAGVPALLKAPGEPAAVRGVVVDGRGFGVGGARVVLFSEETQSLVGETRSEENGDFGFPVSTRRPRIFVRPSEGSGLLSAWSPPSEDWGSRVDFVLHRKRSLRVRVLDLEAEPVEGAEVRAYDTRGEPAVVDVATTDREGWALLDAPQRLHVAALTPALPRSAQWRFDLEVEGSAAELEFTLAPVRVVRGRMVSSGMEVADALVLAERTERSGGWSSFAFSGADGRFELACPLEPLVLLAVAPNGAHLPARLEFDEPPQLGFDWPLEVARVQRVRTKSNGFPLQARVWSWSPEAQAWSYGARTGARGEAQLPVGETFSVHARPYDPAYAPLEAWDVRHGDLPLNLEAVPRP